MDRGCYRRPSTWRGALDSRPITPPCQRRRAPARLCALVWTIGRVACRHLESSRRDSDLDNGEYRQSLTRRTQVPLWHIYCPESAYSAEDKCALATRITDLYADVGLPRFYVSVIFHELPKTSFFVGGKATNDF